MRRLKSYISELKNSNILRKIQNLIGGVKFFRLSYYHSIVLGFVGLLLILLLIFFNSPIFAIRQVMVSNSKPTEFEFVDPKEIESVVLAQYYNSNLIRLDGAKLADEIKASSTFVKEAFVNKQPRDTVAIELVEREPALLIATFRNCILLDDQSFVMVKVDGEFPDLNGCDELAPIYEVPVMRSTQITVQFNIGERSSYYEIEEIVKVLKVLDTQGYRVKDGYYEDKKFIFSTYSDQRVVIGTDENLDEQLKRFIIVTSSGEALNTKFSAIDLRFERPVLTK